MEAPPCDILSPSPRVKATFHLGLETYSVHASMGILSEQLVLMKGESMSLLNYFITKHNVPNDVPDELEEVSKDDGETLEKLEPKKQK